MFNSFLTSRIPRLVIAATLTAGCGSAASSVDAGRTTGGACSPVSGATNLLQSTLPAGDAYGNVAADGRYVYFTGGSALYRVPTSGGPAETVYAGGLAGGFFAAADGTVAWVPGTSGQATGLTVKDASGVRPVTLPSGAVPTWGKILMDTAGDVFFELDLPSGGRSHTWRWNPEANAAGEMPGVGMPDAGAGTNLYWADRGQVIWSNNIDDPTGGIYATDISTGTPHQLVDNSVTGFGGMVGLDASNVYGAGSICPGPGCAFTISGVARGGGAPFVAYQSETAYWTNGLRADDSGFYWIDWSTQAIYHARATGVPATVVVSLTSSPIIPAQLALDACNVYWLDSDPMSGGPRVMAIWK